CTTDRNVITTTSRTGASPDPAPVFTCRSPNQHRSSGLGHLLPGQTCTAASRDVFAPSTRTPDPSDLIALDRMPGMPLIVFQVSRRDDSSMTALLMLAALVLPSKGARCRRPGVEQAPAPVRARRESRRHRGMLRRLLAAMSTILPTPP